MATPLVLVYLFIAAVGIVNGGYCSTEKTETRPTLYFTPSLPPQIAPTSTVYGGIVTYYLNVVDCNYVTVQNVDHNPPQTGQFTARSTSSLLTVVRVGCMDPTEVITRAKARGLEVVDSTPSTTAQPRASTPEVHHLQERTNFEAAPLKSLLSIAGHLSVGVNPIDENITVNEFRYLEELNTALFALNIVNSGLPLDKLCTYLRDPALEKPLSDSVINRDVAGNIVCYAAQYGLYFGQSNEQLLADLAAMEYAIQTHAYGSETLQETCGHIQYDAASLLGVDVQGIAQAVCNTTIVSPSNSVGTATIPLTGTSPATSSPWSITAGSPATFTFKGTGTAVWPGPGPALPTESIGLPADPWSNTSSTDPAIAPRPQVTGPTSKTPSFLFGTNGPSYSSASSAAGTDFSWLSEATVITTVPVLTVTASAAVDKSETTSTQGNVFYNPPRQLRDRLRRHG